MMIVPMEQFVKQFTKGKYVLVKIDQFGDFEVEQRERDLYVADTREELVEMARKLEAKYHWRYADPGGWNDLYIRHEA